jgi:excisionase family DNA binding protein
MGRAIKPGQEAADRLYYRAKEVSNLTGLGLRTVYAGVYSGTIPSRKIGNARLIPASWLLADQRSADTIVANFSPRFESESERQRRKLRYSVDDGPHAPCGASRFLRLLAVSEFG